MDKNESEVILYRIFSADKEKILTYLAKENCSQEEFMAKLLKLYEDHDKNAINYYKMQMAYKKALANKNAQEKYNLVVNKKKGIEE